VAAPESSLPAYKAGFFYRGVSPVGMRLGRLNDTPRKFEFPCDYRNPIKIMDSRADYCPIILKVNKSSRAASYFEDRIVGVGNFSCSAEVKNRIKDIFLHALSSASALLGDFKNPSPDMTELGLFFMVCNDHFEKISDETIGQENRAVIFQAAVLCRLHAWIGNAKYSENWTLNCPTKYDCICSLVASIWKCPVNRDAFIKNIAPIEWLITWFKSPKFNK
jgi:hypothetical protein